MVQLGKLVCTSALILMMAACGGGGGGGGGFPVAAPTGASNGTGDGSVGTGGNNGSGDGSGAGGGVTQPGEPTITLSKSGNVVSANSAGQFSIKPGAITINVSLPVNRWTIKSSTPSATFVTPTSIPNSTSWAGTLANVSTTAQTITFTVEYGDSTATKTRDIVINLAAADPRNGQYWVFAGSGQQYRLNIDFDFPAYEILTSGNLAFQSGGVLDEDPSEAGTYVMVDARTKLTNFNPNRFRIREDVMVGEYLFDTGFASMAFARMYYPFVAVKTTAMVTQQPLLDGVYNRMEMRLVDSMQNGVLPAVRSKVGQVQVSLGGTLLTVCDEVNTISLITSCAGTLTTYTGIDGGYTRWWTFTNTSNPQDKLNIGAVRMGGETILLEAAFDLTAASERVFRIGMPETNTWQAAVSRGGGDQAHWSKYTFSTNTFSATGTLFDGTTQSANLPLAAPLASSPQGVHYVMEPSSVSFVMQSSRLTAMVGGTSWYGGFLQVGLKD